MTLIEQKILGGIILDNTIMDEVADTIQLKWFSDPYDKVWAIIADLYEKNLPIDSVSLYEESQKRKYDLMPVFLSRLTEGIHSSANVPYHVTVLAEQFLKKESLRKADELKTAIDAKEDIFETIDKHTQDMMDLTTTKESHGEEVSNSVRRVVEHIERVHSGNNEGMWVDTGFYDLDEKVKFMNGDLIIIAARPSMGKTSLALSIAENIAKEDYVGFFSLEMNNDSITTRLISGESGIPYLKLLTGGIKAEDGARISRASHKISQLKLYIDDSAGLTPIQLMTKARRMKKKYNIKALFVDYIGLMQYPPLHTMREREISHISGSLKNLAKDLDIPVIVLSQLSRAVESRTVKTPQLSDLRDSGSLEQDADVVLFLYRPEYYGVTTMESGDSTEGIGQVLIRKQRNGGIADINLKFLKETTKFKNLDHYQGI